MLTWVCTDNTHKPFKMAGCGRVPGFKISESHPTLLLIAVNKDEWDIKDDTGKSMENTLYALQYATRHLSGLNGEKSSS